MRKSACDCAALLYMCPIFLMMIVVSYYFARHAIALLYNCPMSIYSLLELRPLCFLVILHHLVVDYYTVIILIC